MVSEEVFLSYNHEDRALAGIIKKKLETLGFTAFLAHEDIEVSAEWRAEIEKHLDSCSGLIAIVTENFAKSSWANQEVGVAMGKGKPVISLVFGASSVLQGFLESLQGIPTSEDTCEEAISKAIQVISEKKKEESSEEIEKGLEEGRIEAALTFYLGTLIASTSGFIAWILDQNVFYWTVLSLFFVGGGLWFVSYTRSWKTVKMSEWCRKHSTQLLFGAFGLLSAGLALGASLYVYTIFSRITLETRLANLPLASTIFFLAVGGATITLYLPRATISARNLLNVIRTPKKYARQLLFVCLIFVLVLASLPLDTVLLIGVPKTSFTESRYIVDGQIHIAAPDTKNLESFVKNEETIHLLLPLIPLTRNFSISFQSNSSKKPSVAEASGISHNLLFDDDGKLAAIQLSITSSAGQDAYLRLSYFSELNTSSVVRIEGWDGIPSLLQQFNNGTRQYERVINITNVSQHQIVFQDPIWLFRVPLYHEGAPLYYEYKWRGEKCTAELAMQDGLIYLPGSFWIQRGGFIEITIVYND